MNGSEFQLQLMGDAPPSEVPRGVARSAERPSGTEPWLVHEVTTPSRETARTAGPSVGQLHLGVGCDVI
jgi:hypothetical protein